MSVVSEILRVVRSSEKALSTREICCLLNGKSRDYCLNVDGSGGRCMYWFRRPKHESQRIRLVKPDCRTSPLKIMKALRFMVEKGLLKRSTYYLRDRLSKWGYDRHVLYYVSEKQLERRFQTKNLFNYG